MMWHPHWDLEYQFKIIKKLCPHIVKSRLFKTLTKNPTALTEREVTAFGAPALTLPVDTSSHRYTKRWIIHNERK